MVPSFEVFESLTKPTVWVNATRSDANKFYDMGFAEEKKETEVEALCTLQRQLAEMTAACDADKKKSVSTPPKVCFFRI